MKYSTQIIMQIAFQKRCTKPIKCLFFVTNLNPGMLDIRLNDYITKTNFTVVIMHFKKMSNDIVTFVGSNVTFAEQLWSAVNPRLRVLVQDGRLSGDATNAGKRSRRRKRQPASP